MQYRNKYTRKQWILPMYQCNKLEHDFIKQKTILEIDFLLDSVATLNLLNEDTWNEIKSTTQKYNLKKLTKHLQQQIIQPYTHFGQ